MKRSFPFCFFLLSAVAFGQQYSIDWAKIPAGGGTSTNAAYQISGTIGQQDAGGSMAGGSYVITGGFWAFLAAAPTLGGPTLRIGLTGTNTMVVTWPAPSTGFTLQHNSELASGNWSEVTNTVNMVGNENQVIVMRPVRTEFYRLGRQ